MLANCFRRAPLRERWCEPGRLRAGGRAGVRGGATVSALALVPLRAALWAAGAAQCGRGCEGREVGGGEERRGREGEGGPARSVDVCSAARAGL